MSFMSQASLAINSDFMYRVAACYAKEQPKVQQPVKWAEDHIWWVASAPGFAEAYESALLNDIESPGSNPSVISDAQIVAAVQAVINSKGE